ncbi:MAG: RNA-protein complex protein Nop10 [Candidatus Bathyarchaeia archaeon]
MVWLLRRCVKCGKYTLKKDMCPYCHHGEVRIPHPAKFSPDDKYAIYKGMLRSRLPDEKDNNNRERANRT